MHRSSWPWELPNTVIIRWTGTRFEAIATYETATQAQRQGDKVAGIDLGEVHMAVAHDGEQTHLLNGQLLRSKVQYRNKLQAKLNSRINGRMKKGSKRQKRVISSKKQQLKKNEHQMKVSGSTPSSRRHGTADGPAVPATGPRSS